MTEWKLCARWIKPQDFMTYDRGLDGKDIVTD